MTEPDRSEQFVQLLARYQNRLYGYVFSLLGDHSRASDVLQETNLILWRKIDEFHVDKPFLPWAFAIARFQVLAHLRDQKRDRLLLDAELAAAISEQAETQAERLDEFRQALNHCLGFLSDTNRELVERRYLKSMSIAELASTLDRTASAVKVALMRSRRSLADCIQMRMAAEGEQ